MKEIASISLDDVVAITNQKPERVKHSRPNDLTGGVGKALKEIRRRKRVLQEEVAAKLGLERTSIANFERGAQTMSVVNMIRFADALGVDVHISFSDRAPAIDKDGETT